MRKFARRWFGPYMVTSVDNNDTYHLAEVDGSRISVLVAHKQIKAFKKWHKVEPGSGGEAKSVDEDEEPDEDRVDEGSEEDE